MRFVLAVLSGLVLVVAFFVAVLAEDPLISVAGVAAMMLAGAGISIGVES